jgi:hypothetical protein
MIRINDPQSKTTLNAAALVSAFLLLAGATGFGQQVVNLTAGPATTSMPDGTVLPMWGYSCGTAATGSTATCSPLSGSTSAAATGSLGGIYVLNGGSGYTTPPTVIITPAAGDTTGGGAAATAVVSGGAVVGFNVTNHGAGYTAAPKVTIIGATALANGAVAAASPAWSPVVITVPSVSGGASLTINLTNNLSFTPAAGGTANNIPTSIVIVGQVGGGLGTPTSQPSPDHSNAQGCVTWFIAANPPGTPCTSNQSGALPPAQGPRVQSMGTEVTAGAFGTATSTSLTWPALKPGTYLLESGTHPSIQVPMGLIGMLVVTTAPSGTAAGTAYPAVAPSTTNAAVQATVPAVQYNAEVPFEFSEIDPVQNKTVDQAVRTSGFNETRVWSGLPTDPQGNPGCGNPASSTYHTCYPPAVNYTPFYYLINGRAFDKTNPGNSLFATTPAGTTSAPVIGTVLVRLVNAGLRMHVPAIVGSETTGFNGGGTDTGGKASTTVSGFTLIAEDGNPLPNLAAPRVKTEVFMAAGKTYDVMINVPVIDTINTDDPDNDVLTALPIYARDGAMSANSSVRDAGMLAYLSVNGILLPAMPGIGTGTAVANPDTYNSVIPCGSGAASCLPLVITDPSRGVMANDINVYGVALASPPSNGTLTCGVVPGSPVAGICANGTFTYTPNAGSSGADSFGYCANGAAAGTSGLCTTVTLGASNLAGPPVVNPITYTSKMATFLKISSPGVLSVDSDPNGLPLQVALSSITQPISQSGVTINMDPQGGFTASAPGPGSYTFTYLAQNSQGKQSSPATVTLVFPPPSNLQVKVLDAQAYNDCHGDSGCINSLTPFPDYRWIIEEDKTFWVDPNCTSNNSITTPGCPAVVAAGGQATIPTFGVQFHTSTMDFVAQGCTGPLSCEGGQTMLDTNPSSATFGQHIAAVCDLGNGACRPDPTGGSGSTPVDPSQVVLDPSKRYYISVLPGDAGNPFPGNVSAPVCSGQEATSVATDPNQTQCGHTMSGAPIPPACNILGGPNACGSSSAFTQPVNVLVLPTPLPTGKLSVLVFEDDFPLNGEQDGGGGAGGAIAPVEPGLGGFNIVLWDTYGGLGDVTGQNTFDMFNQPLSNSLAGTVDPTTGQDACPISAQATQDPTQAGITGMIVTCPKYESDGHTLSPLAGQAVIANLMPEKFSVQAYPAADRIARGEEWIQTNTLDGQHPHDSFIRIGEPSYFQEYGPAGYHVMIGFANPAIINARHDDVCKGFGTPGTVGPCTNTIDGQVDVERLSRIPDERLYASDSRDALTWTQCWVSLGDPDGEDFMFTKCDANGNFRFTNVPGGNWRLTIGDQWNDQIIDGLSTAANVGCTSTAPNKPTDKNSCPGGQTLHMGNVGVQQWQSNLYTRTFIDDNKNGIWDPGEIGIPLIYTMIHYRDGHNANSLTTDFNGVAPFNETFPLFNWYVVEADSTRYKTTGIHTVYDAGGPADGTSSCGPSNGARPCGTSTAYKFMSNTYEAVPLPADLSVPGAVYCTTADCSAEAASYAAGTPMPSSSTASTGRIDPPWVWAEGWAGLTGHSNWIDFGKAPYAACDPNLPVSPTNFCATVSFTPPGSPTGTKPTTMQVGENGGIYGNVAYASTRPFDDASQMIQQPWQPNVPNVTVNLYQEGFAADGVTPTLTLVDTTKTSSWDDWAQGFYPNSTAGGTGATKGQKPYLSCPGQDTATNDLFYFTLFDQPNYLDWYNTIHSGSTTPTPLPYNSQFKCYDAMKINNQIQPAPFDGRYSFPSSLGIDATSGKPLPVKGSINGVASSLNGTNCTICVANPDSTDPYRYGNPMLPPGKYVVEVIMPPGYEVEKEEDKNLLIGDNFIAPVTQQFGGVGGDVFILPDQASVASMYDESNAGYNPTNYQNSTTGEGLGNELALPAFPGYTDPTWPCVGEMRVVPDYLSLFPQALETAPFAGATRPLCDRKEVTLINQMAVNARFFVFTSTHIASKYTGVITDDFTSEFDPFSPQFGEKFAPPNLPISTKDYLGNELSRVYSDHWGIYDGLTFSSWNVNPPNITGYSPAMMTQCMNDPGPVLDTNPNSPTFGQMIQDPLYNPAYSDFCYEEPYMPGLTAYLDTPVVPTEGFVGAGYNNPDCSYPDATPAISEVDGDDIGPWVSAPGKTLTITALGNQQVNNNAYSGPSANVAPFNTKTITRHYGFGSTAGTVTVGGVPLTAVQWSDTSITGTIQASAVVNGTTVSIPNCPIQQQTQYGGSTAMCGQLVITASNGQQSIDTVTVTIGGKKPTHVSVNQSIQGAIDAAAPGDLIIVDPTCTTTGTTTNGTCSAAALHAATPTQKASTAAHNEMLLMWKPVRLQGVGAASSIIDSNAFPSGKLLDPWRRHVNCLFGLTLAGVPLGSPIPTPTASNPAGTTPAVYDVPGGYSCPDGGWRYFGNDLTGAGSGMPVANVPQVDRIPLESVLGWDATLNGNLAEQLQEPSLMGAYEGAGITILSKGVWTDPAQSAFGTEGVFPAGSLLLQNIPATLDNTGATIPQEYSYCTGPAPGYKAAGEIVPNPYPSNFECNPSSIDGLTIRDAAQGGGGVFIHGWAHNLQIANNRVYNNAGTLSGGITVGQAEFPDAITITTTTTGRSGSGQGEQSALDVLPSCQTSNVIGTHLPYCIDLAVNLHNNAITSNSSLGDELFSGTLSGGGGASFCTGADYYKFNFNWVCGNISAAEGGGITHLGFIYNGDIEHNTIALNQSANPTIPTNGGGIQVMGTPDTDPVCTSIPDADCPPGLSDGTGPNLVINANLIQGNSADSGSGGGIRLQQVNGTDVSTFPTKPALWNSVSLTNNIIVNNLAGWDGAGISLQDSLNVSIVNNTISSNDSLATSGVLTQSIGTPNASAPAGNCTNTAGTASCPQSAGVTSTPNSSLLTTTFTGLTLTCPNKTTGCAAFSNPLLQNNLIWQNRSFYIGVSGPSTKNLNLNQQNQVTLFDAFTSTPAPAQTAFGACTSGVSYWDIGVRGDTGPGNHSSGFSLNPTYSLLDDSGYTGAHNLGSGTSFVSQYCNGARVPPTCTSADGCGGPSGYGVPPGIVDASAPNPVFSLTPSATVDEGNNWINVSWGPLALSDDSIAGADGNYGGRSLFANYALVGGSSAIDAVPTAQSHPAMDFFGNPRPDTSTATAFDIGAIEFQGNNLPPTFTSISPNNGYRGTTFSVTITGTNLATVTAVAVSGTGVTVTNVLATSSTTVTATFTIAANAGLSARNLTITTGGGAVTATNAFTVLQPRLTSVSPTTVLRGSGSVLVTLTGTGLQNATALTVAGTTCGTSTASSTSVSATCAFPVTLATGNHAVSITDAASGATTPASLNLVVTQPTLTSVTSVPTPVERGSGNAVVTLNGTGLQNATAMAVAGVTCQTASATATTVSATCAFPFGTPTGNHAVSITDTVNGASAPASLNLTVTGATLAISGPSPAMNSGGTTTKNATITVTNTATGATAGPFNFSAAPAITKLTGAGTFSIVAGGSCSASTVLTNTAGSNSCTINVQYVPSGTANATANVTVTGTGIGAASQTGGTITAN